MWLLERLDFRMDMRRLQDALSVMAAALVGMALSAIVGTSALEWGDALAPASFASAFSVWWAGDAMGVLIVAPSLLSLRRSSTRTPGSSSRVTEAVVAFTGVVVATRVIFEVDLGLLYLPFPFIIWLSWRFGQRGAAAAALAASAIATWAATQGIGPFIDRSLLSSMATLLAFNASVALASFVLAAVGSERAEAHAVLVQTGVELEQQVQDRTVELNNAIEKLAEAQRLAHLGSWEWDIAADKVTWSEELYRLFGLDPNEFKGSYEAFLERVPPTEREMVNAKVSRSLETGEPFEFQHGVMLGNNNERVLLAKGKVVLDANGKPRRMVGTGLDITGYVRAEEALKNSEERLELVLETANDAFIAMDSNGMIFRWNKQAEVIFGWSRREALGRQLAETIIPPALREAHKSALARYLTSGEGTILNKRIEVMAMHRSGREFPIELTVWPITFNGQTNFNAFIKDVTERKRSEAELARRTEELKRSNGELAQFAYVASHDLQEPMRMVASYVELLERRYADKFDDDGREFIGYAVEGATRMQSLIQALLSYARVDSQGARMASTDLGQVVREVLANLEGLIADAGADVLVGPMPTVEVDHQQMLQLFQNLISNAVKFHSDKPPQVAVEATLSGDEWVFTVADNGIGIDPVSSERIFDVFQRLHTREVHPGLGIGLSLCRRIVDRHGGRIWAENRPEGGTIFSLTIPIRDRVLLDA
jgi:PAS domain S-box-containing protein